jgi:ABC-type Mn2+/Zn2+ transport system ATPase subunit
MLQLLNSKLNFYLQKLEAPCRCYFNEFFEEIIVNERGEECSYFNFSGGESKRIDLAVLFMFQDIRRLQSDVKINISMYDELFDSALDERGAESVLNLLKERVQTNKESIYIISHNKDAVRSGINNIIQLQKQNGITTIV